MKFSAVTLLTPLALLASTVAADAATNVSAITLIDTTTKSLGEKVAAWNGVLVLGTIPIVADSTELLKNLKDAKKAAAKSDPVDDLGAIQIAQAVLKLSGSVNVTLGNIIAAKPKFDAKLLSPVILLNLKQEQKATDELTAEIGPKLPEWARDLARQIIHPVEVAFDLAIEKYKLF